MEFIEISFRHADYGGKLREVPMWNERPSATDARLILLVHGYNVSKPSANKSYAKFRERFKRYPALGLQIREVYWPGDVKFPLIGTLLFPLKIPVAIQTGERLEKYLRDRIFDFNIDKPIQLVLIGHSLGCRVILETLRVMADRRQRPPYEAYIFLMAAGVPVQLVEPDKPLRKAAEFAVESHIFCSIGDEALLFFPIGQKLAGEKSVTSFEAVGSRGNPRDGLWTDIYPQSYLHGDYWTDPDVAGEILYRLGLPTQRSIRERLGNRIPEVFKRQIASWPAVQSRDLPSRGNE
jgi:hypothetical protein